MKIIKIVMMLAISLLTLHAFAQTVAAKISRNASQQERIPNGFSQVRSM